MNCINGKTLYCRDADARCVSDFQRTDKHVSHLSKRDMVICHLDTTAYYRLWNTDLVRRNVNNQVWIYITDNSDMDDMYYRNYGRRRDMAMTQTTKNRLNAFLSYYGFNTLEVHSSQKLYGVWYNKKELENNTWYMLDFASKELVKID